MKLDKRILLSAWMGAGFAAALLAPAGCRTERRTEPTQATQPADQRTDYTDGLAGYDADRAKADLKNQERQQAGTGRPAAPPEHTGSRAVDQPRVSPRR